MFISTSPIVIIGLHVRPCRLHRLREGVTRFASLCEFRLNPDAEGACSDGELSPVISLNKLAKYSDAIRCAARHGLKLGFGFCKRLLWGPSYPLPKFVEPWAQGAPEVLLILDSFAQQVFICLITYNVVSFFRPKRALQTASSVALAIP